MPRISLTQAHDLAVAALMRCNTSQPNAEAVARALIAAEAVGQAGHGLRRMPSYAAQSQSGKVDGHAVPTQTVGRPGVLRVDAQNGFAYPAMDLAVDWLTANAPKQGIAVAGITHSHHCGVAGVTVERLADAGLVAMMFANAPAAMAPWGGRRALFGTDPIAFAAPRADGQPAIVVDVSLSKVARGKIMAADQRGDDIPEGWALDGEGRATTDPKAALAGTMIPMGDAKGTALALMVELLAAGLVGANFGHEASSFFTGEGPAPGVGQLLLAIDPRAFAFGDEPAPALSRFEDLAGAVETQPGARLPGARRVWLRKQAMQDGIEVEDSLLGQIEALGTATAAQV
ncbi:Ldh family oxidoreductase [Paracoccus seriniphilus]|uniref:(2R)-3-sulfolactate dehydrogenase (NADP+) n=1 Tax=Paracoccus seriniphilus TaxID=184748 RepID=A0A239PTM7_9RHOB|nr:Ldh family oxidoreductase [Paracoccus seriniphilus]WCR16422.1 Ldh family oxidoreductase [Paracoccus seriniphilus]SNT73520.1 (2R)-3-sulfolactate dehydrogenase (NADP+) [Paracoccus seriniphilus]